MDQPDLITSFGTASWSLLETSDGVGGRRRVGFLRELEVPEALRRRGHGTRVLEDVLAAMGHQRCEWALALPSPDAVEFYNRLGWRPVPLWMCEGTPGSTPSGSAGYVIRPYEPTRESRGWAALADVYAADSERRSGAVVRDEDYWATRIAEYVSGGNGQLHPRGEFFVAESPDAPGKLLGYVLVHWWHLHPDTTCYFAVTELCTLPDRDGIEAALLAEIGNRATRMECSMRWCQLFLPREQRLLAGIAHLVADPVWSTFVELRAKPLTGWPDEIGTSLPEIVPWSLDVLGA